MNCPAPCIGKIFFALVLYSSSVGAVKDAGVPETDLQDIAAPRAEHPKQGDDQEPTVTVEPDGGIIGQEPKETLEQKPFLQSPGASEPTPEPHSQPATPGVPTPDSRKIAIWSLVGVGGAALIAGGIFGLTSLDEKERYEDRDSDSRKVFKDRAEARAIAAYVSFGVAGAAALTALILFLTDRKESKPATDKSTSPLSVSSDGTSVSVTF